MNIDRLVLAFAGALVFASAVLAATVNTWWLLLAGFVGLNMLQAAFTRFCPLALFLKRFGLKPGPAF